MRGRLQSFFRPKASVVPSPIELTDRRLLEILGLEAKEADYWGKNALKEATVFACIRILADAVCKLPMKVYQGNGVREHYLAPLLRFRSHPSWMRARDLFKALEVMRHLYGNGYAWLEFETKGKNAGKVAGTYPLDSSKVEIFIDDVGLLPGKGRLWYIAGITPLTQLKKTIENAGAASEYLNSSFRTGLQTKGIIYYVGDLNPEAQRVFRKRFEAMASGLKNANRVSLLPLGYQFQPLSLTMADAQFLEHTELTVKQIAAAFGVKNHQLDDLDRATRTNVEHQQRESYVDTLMDILTGYGEELT
mgnify:CR=1 FL=1